MNLSDASPHDVLTLVCSRICNCRVPYGSPERFVMVRSVMIGGFLLLFGYSRSEQEFWTRVVMWSLCFHARLFNNSILKTPHVTATRSSVAPRGRRHPHGKPELHPCECELHTICPSPGGRATLSADDTQCLNRGHVCHTSRPCRKKHINLTSISFLRKTHYELVNFCRTNIKWY
jgi:hypothetical protein